MTQRSRDQFRDGNRKGDQGRPTRWTGQINIIVTREDRSQFLVGTWWDREAAQHWARIYTQRYRGTRCDVVELEFKDFYIPHRSMANTTDTFPKEEFL